jgi:hypothetical protein
MVIHARSAPGSIASQKFGLRLYLGNGPAGVKMSLPQDTASASSPTWSRLDEAGTKMSSSQPASANAVA